MGTNSDASGSAVLRVKKAALFCVLPLGPYFRRRARLP